MASTLLDTLTQAVECDVFRILLLGDKDCGKTSIAFRLAYDAAARGEVPVYICNKNKIESKMPMFVKSSGSTNYNWSSELLSRVHMKYVSSISELKALIAGFHCFEPHPAVLIIDDFTQFVDPLFSVARNDPRFIESCIIIAAYISDVLDHFDGERTTSKMKLVITDECWDPSFVHVMQRYVGSVFRVQKVGEGVGSHAPSFQPHHDRQEAGPLQLVYKRRWSRRSAPSDNSGVDDVVVVKSMQCSGKVLLLTM